MSNEFEPLSWSDAPNMELALAAVLLFHSASPWDFSKRAAWLKITKRNEATTLVLCDTILATLERERHLRP